MNTLPPNNPSRRTALKSIGATSTMAESGLLPSTIYAAPPVSANAKVRVGLIGAGNRAKWLTRAVGRESHRASCLNTAVANDWSALFDGHNLKGWKASRDNTQFTIADGAIIGTSSGHLAGARCQEVTRESTPRVLSIHSHSQNRIV